MAGAGPESIEDAARRLEERLAGNADVVSVRPGYLFRDGWITPERAVVIRTRPEAVVTLDAAEVSLSAPPKPKAAKVEWRFLDESTQNALRESETVTEAYRTRRQECKGAVSGEVSKKCVVADDALSQKIVDHVRSGGALGTPERMP